MSYRFDPSRFLDGERRPMRDRDRGAPAPTVDDAAPRAVEPENPIGAERSPTSGVGDPWRRRVGLLLILVLATGALLWLQRDAVAGSGAEIGLRVMGADGRLARVWETGRDSAVWLRGRVASAVAGPPRIGVQIGHADAAEHPDELAALRTSTGGRSGAWLEVDVNRAVAEALAARLRDAGLRVDLLPATVPLRYAADAFVSIHADSSPDPTRRGYKSAVFAAGHDRADLALEAALDASYEAATGLPDDSENITGNMFGYYAFSPRFDHAVRRRTPAVIVELGYISNADDRAWLARPELLADALAEGLGRFLTARGRPEAAALLSEAN